MIDTILSENKNLKLTKTMVVYLKTLESIIPESLRENFYKNLKTLKVVYDPNIITNGKETRGKYDHKNNIIYLNTKDTITRLRKYNIEKIEVLKGLEQILLHEFVHMSAANYNKEKDKATLGIEETGTITNAGLDEGLTELISIAIVNPKYLLLSDYHIETELANQLFFILGQEVMLNAYYSGTKTSLIDKALNELGKEKGLNEEYSYNMLREMETTHILKRTNYELDSLAKTQQMLLNYLDIKLKNLQSENNQEEIDKIIDMYKSHIITSKKIELFGYSSKVFIGLDKNEQTFKQIVNKYQAKKDQNKIK